MARALSDIFEHDIRINGQPVDYDLTLLHSDRGKEFYNVSVDDVLRGLGIKLYSSHSDHKAAMVERVNRTIRERLVRAMEIKGENGST